MSDIDVPAEDQRPKPPSVLTPEESVAWDRLFLTVDPGWIPLSQYNLVIALCRHIVASDAVAKMVAEQTKTIINYGDVDPDEVALLDKLQKMLDREHRAITSLMTKLRLTNQSLRSDCASKATADFQKKPWE